MQQLQADDSAYYICMMFVSTAISLNCTFITIVYCWKLIV